jgi:hypothetical protein
MDAGDSSLPFPRLIERGIYGCGQNRATAPPLYQARDRADPYGILDDAAQPNAYPCELSQQNEESQKLTNSMHSLLACTTSKEEWISMDEVEAAFLQRSGQANLSWFREVCSYATARGYVGWGKPDLDDMCFGDSEVEVASSSEFDEAAKDAQMRVTITGRETLSKWESSRTPSSPSFGHDSHVKKVFSKEVWPSIVSASGHNVPAVSSVSNTDARLSVPRVSPPLLGAYPRCPDVKAFLDCIFTGVPLDDNLGWVNMIDAVARFAQLYGPPVTATIGIAEAWCLVKPDFEQFLKNAGSEKMVSWGRGHLSTFESVQVVTYQQDEGHSVPDDTFLRLTDKGCKVVFPCRDEVCNPTAPGNSSRDVSVMSELRHQHKRGYGVLRDKNTLFVASSTISSDSVDSKRRPSRNEQGTPQRYPNSTASLSATGDADQGSHNHHYKRGEGSHRGGNGSGRSYFGPSSHGKGDPHAALPPSTQNSAHTTSFSTTKRGGGARRGRHESSDGESKSGGGTHRKHKVSSPTDHARKICQIVSQEMARDATHGGWSLGSKVACSFQAYLNQTGKGSASTEEVRTTYRNAKRLAKNNGWISTKATGFKDHMRVTRRGRMKTLETEVAQINAAAAISTEQTSNAPATTAGIQSFVTKDSHYEPVERKKDDWHTGVPESLWFLPNKKRPCKHFQNSEAQNCPSGKICSFAHIQPRHGRNYMDFWYKEARHMKVPSLSNVAFTERRITGVPGQQLQYSAAYQDPETNIFYVAEGGITFDDGAVSWYPSEKEAKAALEFAFASRKRLHAPVRESMIYSTPAVIRTLQVTLSNLSVVA